MENKFEKNRMLWSGLTYFVILLLFTCLRLANSLGLFNGLQKDISSYIFTLITQIGILFIVPMIMYLLIFRQKPKQIFNSFMFKKITGKSILYSFLLGLTVYFIIMFCANFFGTWLKAIGYEPITGYGTGEKTYSTFVEFLLGMLFVAVLPGFFEEFSNRGMLISGLKKGPSIRAVVLSGLLFGLMHLNINQFFYAFVSGMIMATVAIATKSIWPSMIIHFTNNGINTYMEYAIDNNLLGANLDQLLFNSGSSLFLRFIMYLIFIALVVFLCIWLISKLFIEKKKQQYKMFARELSGVKDAKQKVDMDNYYELMELYMRAEKMGINLSQFAKDLPSGKNKIENEDNLGSRGQNISFANKIKFIFTMIYSGKNNSYKTSFKEKFFIYASLFLGVVVTLFTLIWGFL